MQTRFAQYFIPVVLLVWSSGAFAQNPEEGDLDAPEGDETGGSAEASADLGFTGSAAAGGDVIDPDSLDDEAEDDAGGTPGVWGNLRLGMDKVVFDFTSISRDSTAVGEFSETNLAFGLADSALGFIAGYALNNNINFGTRLAFRIPSGTNSVDPAGPAGVMEQDVSGLELGVLPYFEYIFDMPSEKLRLFAFATAGLRLTSSTVSNDAGETDSSASVIVFGAGGGLHFFLADALSLDPTLEFNFGTGSADEAGQEFDVTTINLALKIGLTGWIEL